LVAAVDAASGRRTGDRPVQRRHRRLHDHHLRTGLMDKTLTDALARAELAGLTDRELATVVEAATQARRDVAERPGLVPMTHPDLPDRPQLVDPEAFEVHKLSGWRLGPDAPPDSLYDAGVNAAQGFVDGLREAEGGLPKGNASRDEWWAYALGHGMTEDDVEPLTRDEIRDHFHQDDEE